MEENFCKQLLWREFKVFWMVLFISLTVIGSLCNVEAKASELMTAEEVVDYAETYAKQGDMDAQYNLGLWYSRKLQDYDKAFEWFLMAAEQGHSNAQNNIAIMYANGEGVEQNYEEVVKWFKKAAEQGNVYSKANLGDTYRDGKGVAQDYKVAVNWYKSAAEQGNIRAQFNLGFMYDEGLGALKNLEEAEKWYKKASEQGHIGAYFNLSRITSVLSNGLHIKQATPDMYEYYYQKNNISEMEIYISIYKCARDEHRKDATSLSAEDAEKMKKLLEETESYYELPQFKSEDGSSAAQRYFNSSGENKNEESKLEKLKDGSSVAEIFLNTSEENINKESKLEVLKHNFTNKLNNPETSISEAFAAYNNLLVFVKENMEPGNSIDIKYLEKLYQFSKKCLNEEYYLFKVPLLVDICSKFYRFAYLGYAPELLFKRWPYILINEPDFTISDTLIKYSQTPPGLASWILKKEISHSGFDNPPVPILVKINLGNNLEKEGLSKIIKKLENDKTTDIDQFDFYLETKTGEIKYYFKNGDDIYKYYTVKFSPYNEMKLNNYNEEGLIPTISGEDWLAYKWDNTKGEYVLVH